MSHRKDPSGIVAGKAIIAGFQFGSSPKKKAPPKKKRLTKKKRKK